VGEAGPIEEWGQRCVGSGHVVTNLKPFYPSSHSEINQQGGEVHFWPGSKVGETDVSQSVYIGEASRRSHTFDTRRLAGRKRHSAGDL